MVVMVVLNVIVVVALPTCYQERGKNNGAKERGKIRK
jgi:hypothetical protein